MEDWDKWAKVPYGHSKRNPYHEKPSVSFYTDVAWNYAEDVMNGVIPAPKLIQLACKRTLDDYDRSLLDDPDFPFVYDPYKAYHVCWFIENFPHVEGPLGGEFFNLEPWQIWVTTQVFGWVYKEGHDKAGYRRFRNAFIEVPRGNGKSAWTSPLGIYMTAADGERGSQVVSAATSQKQARIILDAARAMGMEPKAAPLMRRIGAEVKAHGIFAKKKFSRFLALTAQGNRLDGQNIHFAAIDEIHAHPTRHLYDVIVTGAKKRPQSLIWCITTAGVDIAGIGYEQHNYSIQVLQGAIRADNFFAAIWTIEEGTSEVDEVTGERTEILGDDWTDPAVWEKVNPNWHVSIDRESYTQEAHKAQAIPSARANFMTKHLNVWFRDNMVCPFDIQIMEANPVYDASIKWDDFAGKPCFAAIDLGSVSDMTALSLLFPTFDDKSEMTVYSMNKFYLPRQAVRQSRISQYRGWEFEKLLTVTEGNVTDYAVLRKDLEDLSQKFNIISVAYDGWNAAELTTRLSEDGFNMMRMAQTVANLSPSTKELDRFIRSKRFRYDNRILLWMAQNTVVTVDTNGNIKPKKEVNNSPMKIDGIITNAMSIMSMIISGVYETPGGYDFIEVRK